MRAPVLIAVVLAACSGPPELFDAGRDTAVEPPGTGLYRPPEPALPAGELRCGDELDVFRHGELSAPDIGDFGSTPPPYLAAGAGIAGDPVFPFAVAGTRGDAGLLYPYATEALALTVFENAGGRFPIRAGGSAFVGGAVVFVEPGGERELVMIDPLNRRTRIRRALESPLPDGVRVAVVARDGGVLLAHGGITYIPLTPALEADGEAFVVDVDVAVDGLRLVRTSEGIVTLARSACGTITHWLDATGVPMDDPICLDGSVTDELASPASPTSEPVWDGSRIVWPFDRGVLELDGRGRPASWTPTRGFGLVAAFGAAEGFVGVRVPRANRDAPIIVLVERETGRILEVMSGPPDAPTYELPDAAAVAVNERRAWILYHLAGTPRFLSIVVDCEVSGP